jgi:uncharacterized BrkB/YihY/UPF0761 family membrane protein
MTEYSAALAYRALFTLVPFFALLVALLQLLGIGGVFEWIVEQANRTLQDQYAEVVE